MGILLSADYSKIDNDELSDRKQAGVTTFIVAGIYGGYVAFCLSRFICLRYQGRNKEAFVFESE